MAATIEDYRQKCWDGALHAYGTSTVFQARAARLKRNNDFLTWVGLGVPVLLGALTATFGEYKLWTVVLISAAVVIAVQLVVSLWAVIKRWNEDLAYSSSSATANESLANRFAALAADPPTGLPALRTQFDKLAIEDAARRERDGEKNVTEKERRRGMRAGLRKFQRSCAACQKVPTTMEPTDCGVCGRY